MVAAKSLMTTALHCTNIDSSEANISPYFRHLGAALADDAADELVGDGHLMALLLAGVPGLPSQKGQS